MNNLAASVNARYLELLGKPAEIPENGYHGHDIIETAQAIIDQDGDKYLDMPEAERLELFKDRPMQKNSRPSNGTWLISTSITITGSANGRSIPMPSRQPARSWKNGARFMKKTVRCG